MANQIPVLTGSWTAIHNKVTGKHIHAVIHKNSILNTLLRSINNTFLTWLSPTYIILLENYSNIWNQKIKPYTKTKMLTLIQKEIIRQVLRCECTQPNNTTKSFSRSFHLRRRRDSDSTWGPSWSKSTPTCSFHLKRQISSSGVEAVMIASLPFVMVPFVKMTEAVWAL